MNKPLAPYTGVIRVAAHRGWKVYCYGVWAYFRLLSHAMDCATDLQDQRQCNSMRKQTPIAYISEL